MDIKKTEKVELHCHLDGIINHQLFEKLNNPEYSGIIAELSSICPVTSRSKWLNEYCSCITPVVQNNAELLCELLGCHLRSLKEQNVIYVEIMLTSFLSQCESMEEQLALYEPFKAMADKYKKTGMQVEFLIAIARSNDSKKFESKIDRVIKIYESGYICGIAIAANEEENRIKPYTHIFKELKKMGMGIEIHAGEWSGAELIWEALEYGYSDRIGHGLSMFSDPDLVKYIKENNIHIEFCPTSNLILTGLDNISEHPVRHAIEQDINFSINTDDPGSFCCDLNSEFQMIQKAFELDETDFTKIKENSLKSSFAIKKRKM